MESHGRTKGLARRPVGGPTEVRRHGTETPRCGDLHGGASIGTEIGAPISMTIGAPPC